MSHQSIFPSNPHSLWTVRNCFTCLMIILGPFESLPNFLIRTTSKAGSCDGNVIPSLFWKSPLSQTTQHCSRALLPMTNLLFKLGDVFPFPIISQYSRMFVDSTSCFFLNFFSILSATLKSTSLPFQRSLLLILYPSAFSLTYLLLLNSWFLNSLQPLSMRFHLLDEYLK